MTQDEREELARALANAIDGTRPRVLHRQVVDRAIAPIIERMIAERVAAAEQDSERRATAAIVAWLRKTNGIAPNGVVRTAAAIACAIERGDHLTAHKPLDT